MEEETKDPEIGIIKISDEVVGVIADLAASEIKGVVGMSSGIVGGITQILSGKKNLTKGVKINIEEESASIDLYLVIEYGLRIPDVASKVQENVKRTVESLTGLNVSAVNVFVQNVALQKPNEEVKEEYTEE
ncbi:Asp23/Gls24 family envelope stress response protein [Clostridium guangxiense]|uniref:Asp23/Gls24 family envelope stress response protein n=1 Tax=Clostridium guangxiense TaxID=1662055 RepID=UPI001E306B60|nr:Asp23/Gls24 family envelope stress response protein [Clostridium guangxiense]MCD2345162.1 Asp23/Gls24 family envelope stress response protein [Clostridium guangxiense]